MAVNTPILLLKLTKANYYSSILGNPFKQVILTSANFA